MRSEDSLIPGSSFGGMLLVAGSCIGAGMLALPIVTGLSGFFPSLVALLCGWAFTVFTALLLLEISGWFFKTSHLLSMTKASLGLVGQSIAWVFYLFLFYSLLVAYIAASGSILSVSLTSLFNTSISTFLSTSLFTLFFGSVIYLGTRQTDFLNRILMGGLIFSYFGMMAAGLFHIEAKLLLHYAPQYMFSSLPVLVVAFGFQNMIPSLDAYMKGDLRRVRLAVLGGSLMALGVYVCWCLLVLGILPFDGQEGILQSYIKGEEATVSLSKTLKNGFVLVWAKGFAFFAIATSFLAQGLALLHFLADGIHIDLQAKKGRFLIFAVIVPPFLLALYHPDIFFKALNFAGGICAMVLFGILPTCMAWIGRYQKKFTSNYHVFGGKPALITAFLFSSFVIVCEIIRIFS